MAASEDTEITLGTGKLLGLFFGLVVICAVFFALGYTLGRKSDSGLSSAPSGISPSAANSAKPASTAAATPMTFYKAVEQQNANPQLTPATAVAPTPDAAGPPSDPAQAAPSSPATATSPQGANPPDAMAAVPATGYFVQVAAVSKQDDAEALVDALKKKQYPAFVSNGSATDKLFRVQLGPFADIKDAESLRARLINDGYNPILKK